MTPRPLRPRPDDNDRRRRRIKKLNKAELITVHALVTTFPIERLSPTPAPPSPGGPALFAVARAAANSSCPSASAPAASSTRSAGAARHEVLVQSRRAASQLQGMLAAADATRASLILLGARELSIGETPSHTFPLALEVEMKNPLVGHRVEGAEAFASTGRSPGAQKVILRLPPLPGATDTDDTTITDSESEELAVAAPRFLPRVILRLNPPSEKRMPAHANSETHGPPAHPSILPKITIRIPRRFTNDASPVGTSGASSPSPPPRAEPNPSTSAVPPKANAKGNQSLPGPSKSKRRKAVEIEDDATDPVDAAAKPADASPKKRQRKTTRAAKPKQQL